MEGALGHSWENLFNHNDHHDDDDHDNDNDDDDPSQKHSLFNNDV